MPERGNTPTRAPPGGHCTFSFGEDVGPTESTAKSANKYASGADQNNGNVMTGYPTTKVVAPPGGKSTVTFDDGHANSPSPKKAAYRAPSYPPNENERLQRGQMPTGGKQNHKFGPSSPEPHSVREQPTYEHNHRFGEAASPIHRDPDRPPVGGEQRIVLGTMSKDPPKGSDSPAGWPNGESPTAAGKLRHTRTRPGESTLDLTPSPKKDEDRPPPGGRQHNIFNRDSLAARHPKLIISNDDGNPKSSRHPYNYRDYSHDAVDLSGDDQPGSPLRMAGAAPRDAYGRRPQDYNTAPVEESSLKRQRVDDADANGSSKLFKNAKAANPREEPKRKDPAEGEAAGAKAKQHKDGERDETRVPPGGKSTISFG